MFSEFFIKRPRFALVISLFLILAGVLCVNMLPVAEYPQISPPSIMVLATYAGASASVISDTVAAPLEAEVNGVENCVYYSSQSSNLGKYTLILTFESGTSEDMALVNVNNAVKRAESRLPSEVVNKGVTVVKRSSDLLGVISFYSDDPRTTSTDMSNYASIHVKDTLSRIKGIGQVVVFGEKKYAIRIWLDPNKMHAFSISEADVRTAVESQNVQASSGSVGTEFASNCMQYKVETKGRLSTPEEFGEIVVKSTDNGRQVRLSDITSSIELGAETYNSIGTFNGQPAVNLGIFKLSDANALQIMNDIGAEMKRLEKNFPPEYHWAYAYDTTEFVRVAMKEIIYTLLLTFALVVAITYLFLQDWRATIIPAITIPVSLIGTFLFMQLLNMSINTLSMFALILVIGSVVDDAICVTENCTRLMEEEKLPPMAAAIKSMEQLTGALIATTLVVVAIYLPIMFYGGMVGRIYKEFAVVMCIALCLSTVNALTLSPALCALVLRPSKEPKYLFRWINIVLNWTRNFYLMVGGFLVRHALVTIVLFVLILWGNYFLFNRLPTAFLPGEDKGTILGELTLSANSTIPQTAELLDSLYESFRGVPGIKNISCIPSTSLTAGDAENLGLLFITLDDWGKRKTKDKSISAIQQQVIARGATFPEGTFNAFVPPAVMGLGATGGVSFSLQATGDQTSQDLAQTTNNLLARIMASGKAMYAFTSYDANTPMLYLDINRQKASALGVSILSIFTTLQSHLGSYYINDFNKFGKTFQVKIQITPELRNDMNIIGQLHVPSATGADVPMSAFTTIRWILGPRQVERFNMFPAASIRTQGLPGVDSGEMMALIQDIVYNEVSRDYQISWTDMSYQESRNEGKIVYLLMISLIVAYLFLVAQYESWTMPISVMLSVATATLGAIIALHLTNIALNIYCQLGLLMLIGLTAKTAILMVEFARSERMNGAPIKEAALTGMRVRFRSVMMTALSFVIGVYPMVVATGAGAGSRQSIGVTTFWGMLVATVVGMMFIPGLYSIFRYMAEGTMHLFHRDDGVHHS